MAQVQLQNIKKVYDNSVTAVKDINLNIADKEFMVIVGPSGCGKTTILRMIAGLEEITEGNITIAGTVVNNIPPKDRDIAMVFQNYALYPHMTVYQNMAFALKLRKIPKAQIKQRVNDAAQMLSIEDILARKPKALSGGQRQRVALARAIVRKPAVFLFDEPLSNLDAKLRGSTRAELKALHSRLQTTTIYVTHDQAEAMTLGQTVVVLRDGTIQQAADPMTLYDHPANRFVAEFIGTPPMNFLDGRIRRQGEAFTFEGPNGFAVAVPDRARAELSAYVDRPVTLGIRPEHLLVSERPATSAPGGKSPPVEARVEVVEPMGSESHVHLSAGAGRLVIRTDSHAPLQSGDTIRLDVLVEKMHFFDPETEVTLVRPRPQVASCAHETRPKANAP